MRSLHTAFNFLSISYNERIWLPRGPPSLGYSSVIPFLTFFNDEYRDGSDAVVDADLDAEPVLVMEENNPVDAIVNDVDNTVGDFLLLKANMMDLAARRSESESSSSYIRIESFRRGLTRGQPKPEDCSPDGYNKEALLQVSAAVDSSVPSASGTDFLPKSSSPAAEPDDDCDGEDDKDEEKKSPLFGFLGRC